MMRKFLSAAALTALCAMPSFAATLNGTFTIDIRNFSDGDSEPFDVEQASSTATAANFNALTSDAVITYTGNLAFNMPAGNSSTTYISTFLANGGGVISDASGVELGFLAGTLLSQATYVTTTFFKITGTLASAVTGTITHDDGITLVANGQTGGVSTGPNTVLTTPFTATNGNFTLYYVAANGNPSILKVDVAAVPVPAGGLLLIGALGGLAALRRRKTA